ncbi:lanthionine synthetase C family protein [Streptomyces johnsoniae]|uniref:Lanthionine synthetase C family protein n=1 Tax=Streptomyces johnsoniae TaxID=3075532 RepID=A0ABU2SBZ1_9ACTN|nr:lanthionine synthetase C family protein [Streptomyces sp. DSM 41886]MDT0445610.1 lanthionine synthetase C family protein [Streptomyces sp. DSM 41886]
MKYDLALTVSDAVASLLADPGTVSVSPHATTTDRQQLAYGALGITLLHIERAASGLGPWQRVHDWLAAASRQPFTSGADSHPFYGAPALAHTVACAAEYLPGPYQRALDTLDVQIATDVRRRVGAAHRRMDAELLPSLAEFDVIRGLSGYGRYLMSRNPGSVIVRTVLDYCVRLTEPITDDDHVLPGWWTLSGPSGRPDGRFPGGHANTGLAHGIAGVLALLALGARHETVVDGHHDAMRTILAWMDRWQEQGSSAPAWPYWVTRTELCDGHLAPSVPRRPSWCYGTAGTARARQFAAGALGDDVRQIEAENALIAALTDPAQLKATTDNGLCHGFAGLAHIAARMVTDAHPSTAERLRDTIPELLAAVCPPDTDPASTALAMVRDREASPGFLNGAAGIALALLASATDTPPRSSWDACLLIA